MNTWGHQYVLFIFFTDWLCSLGDFGLMGMFYGSGCVHMACSPGGYVYGIRALSNVCLHVKILQKGVFTGWVFLFTRKRCVHQVGVSPGCLFTRKRCVPRMFFLRHNFDEWKKLRKPRTSLTESPNLNAGNGGRRGEGWMRRRRRRRKEGMLNTWLCFREGGQICTSWHLKMLRSNDSFFKSISNLKKKI